MVSANNPKIYQTSIDSFHLKPAHLVSFLILISPFTMGHFLSVLSNNYVFLIYFICVIMSFLMFDRILNHKRILKNTWIFPVLVFSSSFFVSLFLGPNYVDMTRYTNYDSTLNGVLKDIVLFVPAQLILICLIYLTVEGFDDLLHFLKIFILSGVIVNIISYFYLLNFAALNVVGISGRLGLIFDDANYMGRFQVMIISISFLTLLFRKQSFLKKIFLTVNIIASGIILYFTFSRSAALTLTIISLLIIIFFRSSFSKYLKIVLILCIIILVPYFIKSSAVERTASGSISTGDVSILGSFLDVSNSTRLGLMISGFNVFMDNPFFGVGYHNFYNVYINKFYVFLDLPVYTGVSVIHNWLISVLAEQGLFGTIPVLWVFVMVFLGLLKFIKKSVNTDQRFIGIVLFAFFFILLFNGLFFPVFFPEIWFSVLFGLIGGYFKISTVYESSSGFNLN